MTTEKLEQARTLLDQIEEAQQALSNFIHMRLPYEKEPELVAAAETYKVIGAKLLREKLAEAERLFAEL